MCGSIQLIIEDEVKKELERRRKERQKAAKKAAQQAVAAAKKAERQAAAAAKKRVAAAVKKAYEDRMVSCLLKVMKNYPCSLKGAMDLLGVPKNMRPKYGKLVKKARAVQTDETAAS